MSNAHPNPSLQLPAGDLPVLQRRHDGRLILVIKKEDESQSIPVTLRPCFPWSEPRRFLSLRDDENNERALILDLDELDAESRQLIEGTLAEARFTFTIERIHRIDRDFDLRIWRVKTSQGERSFLTEDDGFPRDRPDGSIVFHDLMGDLYVVPDPEALDKHSRDLLWAWRS